MTTATGRRGILVAALGVGLVVAFAVADKRGSYLRRVTYGSVCLSTTECLVRNVEASLTLRREVAERSQATDTSPYARYWTRDWVDPPSLYVVMIESYGSILAAPDSPVPYDRFMTRTADSLRADGWHAASAHSTAPVFGGLSWLSAATLFLGTPIEHQPVFEVLRPDVPRIPHLVRLLQRQGYRTATLQPPVRPRPGLSVSNPYGFDRTFYLHDLDYRGPKVGWGIVPDHHSLSVAHEQFVAPTKAPFFLFFETVTPHAPWRTPPPTREDAPRSHSAPRAATVPASMVPADRTEGPPWAELSQTERLFRHVQYDWRVLTDYLRTQAPPNSLVVIVGDHQPYFAETERFSTPVHLLSRDETLPHHLASYGFAPGLRPGGAPAALHHAGLYSLLVRVLTAPDRAPQTVTTEAPPPYRPRGVERTGRLSPRP